MIKVTYHVAFSFTWLLKYSYIKLWWLACLKVFDGNTETDKTFKFKTGKGKVIKVLLNVILPYTFHGCVYFHIKSSEHLIFLIFFFLLPISVTSSPSIFVIQKKNSEGLSN